MLNGALDAFAHLDAARAELQKLDPDVRALVSSGYSTDPVMSAYQDAGFAGVVAKPYSYSELSGAVAEALRAE